MFEVLLGLVVLAVPIAAIAGFLIAIGARNRLTGIEDRLAGLERQIARAAAAPPPEVHGPIAEAPLMPAATPVTPPPDIAASPQPPQPPPPPPETNAPPAPAAAPPERQPSFEEQFGTRWVVWVGGVALALGGIFLVKYSIDAGLIGPGVRIFLGALLAAALIGAGEWTRRQEQLSGVAGLPSAHIPSILTAAGTAVAYATVYAAYALYGFLGPTAAFVLLGLVALATLAAALLHGPALAALGLIGAEVTPLLVASNLPDFWALYIYLAVVTAAAFGLARLRMWQWLAATAVGFGFFWMLPGIGDVLAPHAAHALTGFCLSALLIVAGLFYGPSAERGKIDPLSSGALAAYLVAAALLVIIWHHDGGALLVFTVMVAATVAIAGRSDAAAGAVPVAAGLAVLVMLSFAVERIYPHLTLPGGPSAGAIPDPSEYKIGLHLALGALFVVLFGGAGFLAQGRGDRPDIPILWAATGTLTPLAILIALYARIAQFEPSVPFAAIALLLAALAATATETIGKRAPAPGSAAAEAIFASAAVASLALALTFALEKGWLTVGLALMVPGLAWVSWRRPLPMLRWLATIITALVVARIGWEPRIAGDAVGTTPVFNWLLYGYGVPALSFWVAGYLFRQRADDVPARAIDAAAILFTVLLVALEIRHVMNQSDIYVANIGLGETALQVVAWLGMTIGLERLRPRTNSIVHDVAALALAALSLAGLVIGLWFLHNPVLTGRPVGGPLINLILLGYGLPAALATVLALIARTTRPLPYRAVAAGVSVVTALLYLSLQIARFYHGPVLNAGPLTNAEQYTYSAVWLTFGVVLLLFGIALGSKPARLASAAVTLVTVAKVFLIDMADLTGGWRALSFIVLGLVLVGIGYLYQRLLFPRRAAA